MEQDQRARCHKKTQKIINDLQKQGHPVKIITKCACSVVKEPLDRESQMLFPGPLKPVSSYVVSTWRRLDELTHEKGYFYP